jgi:SNF2 family DNA or RNA helicase
MATPLWDGFGYKPHQEAGIKWMIQRENDKDVQGGILCDEMGLGKTIQMLGLLKASTGTHTLLLAPVAVLNQWADLAKKSKIAVYRPHVTGRHVSWEKEGKKFLPNSANLYLIGYELARSKYQLVTMMAWDRLICDEAHRCASGKGLTNLVRHITVPRRWFLTATPIVNSTKDLTTLFELLGLDDIAGARFDSLGSVIKKYVLARSMDDLRASIPDAPPKPVIETLTLPFVTPDEHEFYIGMSGAIVKRWKAIEADGMGAGKAMMRLQLFMRLRQLSVHPQVYIESRKNALTRNIYNRPDWTGPATKFEKIFELTKVGAKWIIFCHFHPEMELLKAQLKTKPWIRNVYTYNGSMSHNERTNVLEATKDPLPEGSVLSDVLLIQLQAGGVGLNLQHFTHIIFSGPWWTSALMEQAIGRAVRIGQKAEVQVYHLRLEEEENINIDKVMMAKAEEKGDLCKATLAMASRNM